jgi:hypothetical protein
LRRRDRRDPGRAVGARLGGLALKVFNFYPELTMSSITDSAKGLLSFLVLLQLIYRREVAKSRIMPLVKSSLAYADEIITKYKFKKAPFQQTIQYLNALKQAPSDDEWMPVPKYAKLLLAIRFELMKNSKKWLSDPELNHDQVQLGGLLIRMMGAAPENIHKVESIVVSKLRQLGNPVVSRLYLPEYEDQTEKVEELKFLVKKLVGRKDTTLTPSEYQELSEKGDKRLARYRELHRDARSVYKAALQDYMRSSEKDHVPIPEARKALESSGVELHPLRKDFDTLHINEDGKLTTTLGKEIGAMPHPSSIITMNPKYNPKTDNTYVFKYVVDPVNNPAGGTARTVDSQRLNMGKRDEKIGKALKVWDKAQQKWRQHLTGRNPHLSTMGAIAEVVNRHAPRIGSFGQKGLGLTTLKVSNTKVLPNGNLKLSYIGKAGMKQTHVLDNSDQFATASTNKFKGMLKGKSGRELRLQSPDLIPKPYPRFLIQGVSDSTQVHRPRPLE